MEINMNGKSKRLTPDKAFELLLDGMDSERFARVINHSRYVGILAGRIAEKAGADGEYAVCLGFLHDVGRKIDTKNHAIAGYRYLLQNGYTDYADICLTHSFLNNDIDCICACLMSRDAKEFEFIKEFVKNHKNTLYDKIIQI